ncbi:MAG: Cell division protein ZapE [Holosporales bacterium]
MGFYRFFSKYINQHGLLADDSQNDCVKKIDSQHKIWQEQSHVLKRVVDFLFSTHKNQGIYLFGPVGSGKTMLLDLYFDYVEATKKRDHFKKFMLTLQQEGFEKTILALKGMDYLFLDEFEIVDIADALIVKRLFLELAKDGVKIILTSNLKPFELYQGGLHFDRFQPFIPYVEKNFLVIPLNHGIDYRVTGHCDKKNNEQSTLYNQTEAGTLLVLDKKINFIPNDKGDIFSFYDLCCAPLGPVHFAELAHQKNKIQLINVPDSFNNEQKDSLRRFITLVDLFYDEKKIIKMLPSPHFVHDQSIHLPVDRLKSRLIEMFNF